MIVVNRQPVRVVSPSVNGRVVMAKGPWRTSGEWWLEGTAMQPPGIAMNGILRWNRALYTGFFRKLPEDDGSLKAVTIEVGTMKMS